MFKMHANTSRMSYVININIGWDILLKKHNKSQYCTKRKCLLKIYAIHPMLDASEGAACFWWTCVCARRLTGFTIYLYYKSPLANTLAWCLCWEEVEYLSSTKTSILPCPVWNTQNCSVSGWFDPARTKGVLVSEASDPHSSEEFLRDPLAFCKALNSIPALIRRRDSNAR